MSVQAEKVIGLIQQYWWLVLIILVLVWLFVRPAKKRAEDAGESPP